MSARPWVDTSIWVTVFVMVLILGVADLAGETEANEFEVTDGKGTRMKSSLGAKPLSFYTDSLFLYSMELQGDHSLGKYRLTNIQFDTVGALGPHVILEMRFISRGWGESNGKAILITEREASYDILHLVIISGVLDETEVVKAHGYDILFSRVIYSGQTQQFLDRYWLWCDESVTVRSLELFEGAKDSLKHALPKGSRTGHFSRLNVNQLFFDANVYRASDLRYSTGGSVRVRFALVDCELLVSSTEYDSVQCFE